MFYGQISDSSNTGALNPAAIFCSQFGKLATKDEKKAPKSRDRECVYALCIRVAY